MCDCINKQRQSLIESNPTYKAVIFKLSRITAIDNPSGPYKTGQAVEIIIAETKNKKGERKVQSIKTFVSHIFCPFCGENMSNNTPMSNIQNTVSPETALRLKDAGFPQPEIELGQVWHGRGKTVQILDHNIENNYVEYITDSRRATIDSFASFSELFAYLPTIPDLFFELGNVTVSHSIFGNEYFFFVNKDKINTTRTNLAEALALMWETINES